MTPAECVIDAFRGVRRTAELVGVAPSTVTRWRQSRRQGGTGGMVPEIYHSALMAAADRLGRRLTIEHLRIGKPGMTVRVIRRLDGTPHATPSV